MTRKEPSKKKEEAQAPADLGAGARSQDTAPERKEPRPHQREAIENILGALKQPGDDVRATAVMPCGTGKTLVGLWASEQLGERTLLVEPTLALISQNLREWRANSRGEVPQYLVVCSDKSVVRPNADEVHVTKEELGARVTSSPAEIAEFLRNNDSRKVLISTYQSLPLVAEAMKLKSVPRFDCAVADEAHRTATSKKDSVFSTVLDNSEIRARTRLFLTATPKVFVGDNGVEDERVVSMDDEELYGQRCHTLTFDKAVGQELLCDYQLVVAAISDKEARHLPDLDKDSDSKYAIAELAFLRAAQKHNISKAITFHSAVRKAHALADRFEDTARTLFPDRETWSCAVDGKMKSHTRNKLLGLFGEQPPKKLAVISNCMVLTEGVDVPAIDCVVFFDGKKDEKDVIQAIGRAMRRAPGKEIGTIVVPVIVPDGADADAVLSSSEFRKIWQVVRALRAHDERFEIVCKRRAEREGREGSDDDPVVTGPRIEVTAADLSELLQQKLDTKIISVGQGLLKSYLTIEMIHSWIKHHFKETGSLPSQKSGKVLASPSETWMAIDSALRDGLRGLPGGSSLSQELKSLGLIADKQDLTLETIHSWIKHHFKETDSLPTMDSGKVLASPSETWRMVDRALSCGLRGLPGGSSVSQEVKSLGLRADKQDLTLDTIHSWTKHHLKETGSLPSQDSGKVLASPSETWKAVNWALSGGGRGLPGGSSLSQELKSLGLRADKQKFTLETIHSWIQHHFNETSSLPTVESGKVLASPSETWQAVGAALRLGLRGLPGGSSLSQELKSLGLRADKQDLTLETIHSWTQHHFKETGSLPTVWSGKVLASSSETWKTVDSALRDGGRGLSGGSSLSQELKSLGLRADKQDLTLETIHSWIKHHFKETGSLPTMESGKVLASPSETWGAVGAALRLGFRGLPGGSSLSQELKSLGLRADKQKLTLEMIHSWIQHHFKETGSLPSQKSGNVLASPSETWKAVNWALSGGGRGLPGGSSLSQEVRSLKRVAELTDAELLAFADLYNQKYGTYPNTDSGPVAIPLTLTWMGVDHRLASRHKTLSRWLEENGRRNKSGALNSSTTSQAL